jgi:hypothetical protein
MATTRCSVHFLTRRKRTMKRSSRRLAFRMTLARVFTIGILCAVSCPCSASTTFRQSQTTATPAQGSPPSSAQTAPTPQRTPEKNPSSPPKLRHHKRKAAPSDCASSVAASSPPSNSSSPAGPANCPPAKVVVHNGGSSEPSIQLVGGDSPHQSDTAVQLLGETEANLKRIDAGQLTSSQQETVSQIHQFMDQSKAAVAAGDSERARTLALKAQMLSEELIKPPK